MKQKKHNFVHLGEEKWSESCNEGYHRHGGDGLGVWIPAERMRGHDAFLIINLFAH
jgi:hypothetical protein